MAWSAGLPPLSGGASLVRQFEFAMNVWVNDPNFKELGNERDPLVGTQDGTFDMTIPKRPAQKENQGLPAFTTIRGGAYFFVHGIGHCVFSHRVDAAAKPRLKKVS